MAIPRKTYDRVACQLVLFDKNQPSHLSYKGTPEAVGRLKQLHENANHVYTALEEEGLG